MTSEPINPYVFRSLVSKSVQQLPLPSNGVWEGERGNSRFTLSDNATVVFWANGECHELAGAEVKSRMQCEYGVDSVRYDFGEPDFAPYADGEIGSVEIGSFSTDRSSNFHDANEVKAAELGWDADHVENVMGERALTWHECGDMKTLIAVPTYIHAAFSHGGGVAVKKSLDAVRSRLTKRFPNGFVLKRQEGTFHVAKGDLDRAIDGVRKLNQEEKRQLVRGHHALLEVEGDTSCIGTRELAKERGVSVETVRRWCRSGKVPGAEKDSSGRWRIPIL